VENPQRVDVQFFDHPVGLCLDTDPLRPTLWIEDFFDNSSTVRVQTGFSMEARDYRLEL